MKQKLSGPMLTRADGAAPSILDEENRLVRVSFSSETPYKRSSWFDEPWIEVLGHKDGEIDLSRLNGKACPVLYGHNRHDRRDRIGIVERAWVEDGRGYADIRISKRADVDDVWGDLKDGILRNISVGYQILERTLTKKNEKLPSEYRVTRWLPMEISLVDIPADPTVGVGRSDDAGVKYVITDLNEEESSMTRAVADTPAQASPEAGTAAAPTPTAPQVDATAAAQRAVEAERARVAEINALASRHGVRGELVEKALKEGMALEAFRAAVLDDLATRDVHHNPRVDVVADGDDKHREAAVAWLLNRSGYRDEKGQVVSMLGNELRGLALLEMARLSLERRGIRTRGMSRMEIAKRAITHSTSDFPVILENVMHKTLLTAFAITPDTWRRFCAVGTLADFRPHYRYRMGSFSDLKEVTENNEFEDGTISDAEREQITAATKGRILNVSRQMIVNDDVGAFTGLASLMGRAAKRSVEKDVYAVLALNGGFGPTMSDGKALFHVDHKNVSTGAPSMASFDVARAVMASQTNPGGDEVIDLRPAIWLGPVTLGGDARTINEAQYDPDTSSKLQRPNKVRGLFRDVVDTARLTGTPWYMFADPNEEPVLEVGFLDGQQEPVLEMQEGFRVDGTSWKVRYDYAVAGVGYRGAVRSTGS